MTPVNPTDPHLTAQQVAERLGITTYQVARLVKAGKLSCTFKLGGLRGARLFTEDDIATYQARTP